jgi:hypothetical protein
LPRIWVVGANLRCRPSAGRPGRRLGNKGWERCPCLERHPGWRNPLGSDWCKQQGQRIRRTSKSSAWWPLEPPCDHAGKEAANRPGSLRLDALRLNCISAWCRCLPERRPSPSSTPPLRGATNCTRRARWWWEPAATALTIDLVALRGRLLAVEEGLAPPKAPPGGGWRRWGTLETLPALHPRHPLHPSYALGCP